MYIFNYVNFHLSCFLKQFYVAKHICTLYNYKYIVYLDSTLKAIVPHICKAITENHVSEIILFAPLLVQCGTVVTFIDALQNTLFPRSYNLPLF